MIAPQETCLIQPDDLAPGEDPLPLARRYDRVLFRTESVVLGETRIPGESALWRCADRTTDERVFLFPLTPFGLCLASEPKTAVHAGQVLLPWTDVPFRRQSLEEGANGQGEVSDWIWFSPDLFEELDLDRKRGANWLYEVAGPTLLRQRHIYSFVRRSGGHAERDALAVESEALAVAGEIASERRALDALPPTRSHRATTFAAIGFLVESLDSPVDLAGVARAAGVSKGHLCRVFRRVTGRTLGQYANVLRLCSSLDRLQRRALDLTELAFELGFSSHSHFSARFRSMFGCSPSTARALLAGEVHTP